ncbi:MAG TPA: hypothetical protein VHM90_07240 [Phycisphaerae bacterium]|nr:hypothetical protein [Phycisphaerae bacterium]
MSDPSLSVGERAGLYCIEREIEINDELGAGKDGSVFSTDRATAVKDFVNLSRFENERDCYQRLAETQTVELLGHNIPTMLQADDALMVIEMTMGAGGDADSDVVGSMRDLHGGRASRQHRI